MALGGVALDGIMKRYTARCRVDIAAGFSPEAARDRQLPVAMRQIGYSLDEVREIMRLARLPLSRSGDGA